MTISRASLAIVLAIVVCIAGAPMIQPLDEQVLSPAELAEELARSYDAFEWQSRNLREGGEDAKTRNLDHIGGGNLLRDIYPRNLDRIGGGNLLRDAKRSDETSRFPANQPGNVGKKLNSPSPTLTVRNMGSLESRHHGVIDDSDRQTNLDHITGGTLLGDSELEKREKWRWARSSSINDNRLIRGPFGSGTSNSNFVTQKHSQQGIDDSPGSPKLAQRAVTDDRDLQIGFEHNAGDLLNNLEGEKNKEWRRARSPPKIDTRSNRGPFGSSSHSSFVTQKHVQHQQVDDSLEAPNFVRRAIMKIDDDDLIKAEFIEDLLKKLESQEYEDSRWAQRRQEEIANQSVDKVKNDKERNLDRIGGGNLLRDLYKQGEYKAGVRFYK